MLSKLTGTVLFAYVMSIYIFTYRIGLNTITNIIAGCFVYLVFVDLLVSKRKIKLDRVIFIILLFITISTFSYFVAFDGLLVLIKIRTLLLNLVFLAAMINYLIDNSKILRLMKYYVYSGTAASIYIFLKSDYSSYSRLGGVLGNENGMSLIIGISFIFGVYFVFFENNFKYIIMGAFMIPIIILTGSRKGILFLTFSIFIIMLLLKTNKKSEKIKYMIFGLGVLAAVVYITFKIPAFYQVLGKRIFNLLGYFSAEGTNEGSILQRASMIKYGIEMFTQRPILGYGLDNYKILFGDFSGIQIYSHNNYIELLVGTGVVGTAAFYSIYTDVLIRLYKRVLFNDRLALILFSLNATIVLVGYALVHYDSKHFFILLAMSAAISRLNNEDCKMDIIK